MAAPIGPATDLWALGALLFRAVQGHAPYPEESTAELVQMVCAEPAAFAEECGPLRPVVESLLRQDPTERLDFEELRGWLRSLVRSAPEPEAGVHVIAAPPVDTSRLPIVCAAAASWCAGAAPDCPRTTDSPWPSGSTAYGPGAGAGTGAVPPPSYFPPAAGTEAEPEPGASGAPPGNPVTPGAPGATSGLPGGGGSGLTAVQSPSGGVTPAGPRRLGRVGLIALVVVLAALVGGGTAMLLIPRGDGRTQDSSSSASPFDKPKPTPTPTPEKTGADDSTQTGGLPAGWVRRDDPFGFSIVLPGDDWERVVFDEETRQVDYTPDGGRSFIRIAADDSPDFDDPYEHLSDLDQQIGQRLVDYRQMGLERRVYRDRESARLEYTWTALAKDTEFPGPYQAVDQMYLSRDGVEYAIYMASPAEDWATTSKQFETVLQGWREPR
ncbi:serine/threonine-protein kinase [Streptomyces hirsutus]